MILTTFDALIIICLISDVLYRCTINANEIKINGYNGGKFGKFGIGESRPLLFNPSVKIYAHGSKEEYANPFKNTSVLVKGNNAISEVLTSQVLLKRVLKCVVILF